MGDEWITYTSLKQVLDEQSKLQAAFPIDKTHPATRTGEARADYIRTMALACIAEVMEAVDETKWKTWVTNPGEINRDGFVSELIDAWQFLLNLFAVANVTEEEMYERIFKKHQKNWIRIERDPNANMKCPVCKRALDDEYVKCSRGVCRAFGREDLYS